MKCPCSKNKHHLGCFAIIPKQCQVSSKEKKALRKFFIGNGIKTKDAAKGVIFWDFDVWIFHLPPNFDKELAKNQVN